MASVPEGAPLIKQLVSSRKKAVHHVSDPDPWLIFIHRWVVLVADACVSGHPGKHLGALRALLQRPHVVRNVRSEV